LSHQLVYDIAAICAKHGIKQAIICPGSRSAPLLLGFTRHPSIKCFTFSDERSAAFFALGMAQSSGKAVALICTSGTAVYNFAPAIAEAYYSNTPLLVLTADRPQEWIDQLDGQTIRQQNVYADHIKAKYNYPAEFSHADIKWHTHRMVNEAIIQATTQPKGPVHINVPLREPLYSKDQVSINYSEDLHIFKSNEIYTSLSEREFDSIKAEWQNYHHKLLVIGQTELNTTLSEAIQYFSERHQIPVVADIISNQQNVNNIISYQDLFLGQSSEARLKSLQPDLLITLGLSVISKNLKIFLRKYKSKAHWHIQIAGNTADTFKQLSRIINADPVNTLNLLTSIDTEEAFQIQKQENYYKLWQIEQRTSARTVAAYFPQQELNELELVNTVLKEIPDGSGLHLANSMSVRYANFLGLDSIKANVKVWSNRGTSGIDGCTSTAAGHALNHDNLQILITGDMAFFYDRNAFWNNYPLNNLRIILLNNHGSLIFGLLDGPSALPEFEEFFETKQKLNAKALCAEFGLDYLKLDNKKKLKNLLKDFFDPEGPGKVLEIESASALNKNIFESLKIKIKSQYEA
jgi:2-succinyl-5-enolpyruvyl-6-hydroxy-3-cyclohexene-1-carboxylate synthase